MTTSNIDTGNTVFVLLSFEGPDGYSRAGGLGTRITTLAETLAQVGFPTHFFFIGDPHLKGEEVTCEGKLWMHRWCQWISKYHPNGVYQGEFDKLNDFNQSIPPFITERIIKPAVAQNKMVAILGEEWHTADAMCNLSDHLYKNGIRDKVVMFWNANNTFGFEHINWKRLAYTATITTVSYYMKSIMRNLGLQPLVIPNGIPATLLSTKVDRKASAKLKKLATGDLLLSKVARFDPDKRWREAVEAIARLKARGRKPTLLVRGGIEPYGGEIMHHARSLGLRVKDVSAGGNTQEDYVQAIRNPDRADILNIKFHCSQDFLQTIYHASDAVLANSGHEPFGLVGLETMAAGGIAFTGGTGEDYATPFYNSIVLETSDPREIEAYMIYLDEHPDEAEKIRSAGRDTARQFTWENVVDTHLLRKLKYQATIQGILVPEIAAPPKVQPVYRERVPKKHEFAFAGASA